MKVYVLERGTPDGEYVNYEPIHVFKDRDNALELMNKYREASHSWIEYSCTEMELE